MNKRLKEIRQELGLNQEAFSSKIGIARSHVSSIENGSRMLTDRTIKDICREFNVNETWLRTGEGDMFIETDNSLINQLASEYNFNDFEKKMLETYSKLSKEQRESITSFMMNLATELIKNDEIATTSYHSNELTKAEKMALFSKALDDEEKGRLAL